ncbi:S46 family peptidase [Salinibacter altiplanensis]|uniref:S46 family peptidase n=1 Tax=Salinibacter altiplanensis TaxID=1803181 RepID=UPI000C9F3670|nr:S46 family peptidase [Salinibacter altiplanensis]
MTRRDTARTLTGIVLLLWSSLGGGHAVQAQDRGAPRFGPAALGDTAAAETSTAGRVWSLVTPPADRFAQRYGMDIDRTWATQVRRGVLRLSGCTGALVSAEGLALTTARCVRRHLDERGDDAVVAERPAEERSVPGLYADRLVQTSDVTTEVRGARQDTAVAAAVPSVQRRLQSETDANRHVEVVADGNGTYTAYTYRRHEDVRVAFLPTRMISAFGGLDAARTYPRPAFDVALVRVYTSEGKPLSPDHFFEPSSQGARPGDAVLSAGPSTATRRAESAAQLAVRRDLVLPERRDRLVTWTRALRSHLDTAEATPPQQRALRGAERALKQTRARLEALRNEHIQARLEQRDARVRRGLRQDPALQERFGGLLDSLAAIQDDKRRLRAAYRAFGDAEGGPYGSSTYRRMLRTEKQGRDGRIADGDSSDSFLKPLDAARVSSAPVETALLAARLEAVQRHLRPDTAVVDRLLGGESPAVRAASVVEQLASLSPEDEAQKRPADGPTAEVAAVVAPRARSVHEQWRSLTQAERRLTRRLARARKAVGAAPALRSNGAPRLTDGRVRGYPYNGTTAPPVTTIFGLYEQHRAFGAAEPWGLPAAWQESANDLDRSVPLTLVASVDGAVSNNGAPLLNPSLELVGVAVAPNIQGTAGTYLFLPGRMRTVGTDVRGLREALATVYEADMLVDELFGDGLSDRSR